MARADDQRSGAEGESEIKVTDRRLFTADGTLREGAVADDGADDEPTAEAPAPPPRAPEAGAAGAARDDAGPGFERRSLDEPEGVDFTMLINAMAEPALLFLGEIAHPASGQPTVDLERAKIQIDMLDLLRIKSRGNLSADEDRLLDQVLYQLRMLYVRRADQPGTQS